MKTTTKSQCDEARPYRLNNKIQHYSWGSSNDNAFIPHLLGLEPEADQPYAELWMGIHPNSPSQIIDPLEGSRNLASWISENPEERLGFEPTEDQPTNLPYLLKVLSADTALSIQAHPNKTQAELLHGRDPGHYPDDNHKPEIAIAIDNLDALVGFISSHDYIKLLKNYPEFHALLQLEPDTRPSLQEGVFKLLEIAQTHRHKIESTNLGLQKRLSAKSDCSENEQLFLDLIKKYGPDDIGLLFLFLLQRIHLSPGEAVYLAPGVPHAYLKGNIIECMANSDNVVRLGLTGKYCDAQALAEILVFDEKPNYRVDVNSDGYMTEYLTATKEFRVKSLQLLQGESRAFAFRSKLTMFLVLEGEVCLQWGERSNRCTSVFRRGNTFITPANLVEFTIQSRSHSKLYLVDFPGDET